MRTPADHQPTPVPRHHNASQPLGLNDTLTRLNAAVSDLCERLTSSTFKPLSGAIENGTPQQQLAATHVVARQHQGDSVSTPQTSQAATDPPAQNGPILSYNVPQQVCYSGQNYIEIELDGSYFLAQSLVTAKDGRS